MSYHNGSIWPHDTSICAAGISRYGGRANVVQILNDIFETANQFGMRLPELYCGFPRVAGQGPAPYPVACLPQAWSSGSVFLLLQACLGIQVDGERQEVHVTRPTAADRRRIARDPQPAGRRRGDRSGFPSHRRRSGRRAVRGTWTPACASWRICRLFRRSVLDPDVPSGPRVRLIGRSHVLHRRATRQAHRAHRPRAASLSRDRPARAVAALRFGLSPVHAGGHRAPLSHPGAAAAEPVAQRSRGGARQGRSAVAGHDRAAAGRAGRSHRESNGVARAADADSEVLTRGDEPVAGDWLSAVELITQYDKYCSSDELQRLLANSNADKDQWRSLLAELRDSRGARRAGAKRPRARRSPIAGCS